LQLMNKFIEQGQSDKTACIQHQSYKYLKSLKVILVRIDLFLDFGLKKSLYLYFECKYGQ